MSTEENIAAGLKNNIPVQDSTPPVANEPVIGEPAFQSNITLGDPVVTSQLHDYFGLNWLEKHSDERQHQLTTILEWASATAQSNNMQDILNAIQHKEQEIGRNPFKDRLKTLYRLAKIEAQTNFLEVEKRALYE